MVTRSFQASINLTRAWETECFHLGQGSTKLWSYRCTDSDGESDKDGKTTPS